LQKATIQSFNIDYAFKQLQEDTSF